MFRTLYGKLAAVLFLLFLGIGVLFVVLTLFTTRAHLQEMNQRLNLSLARHIASENPLLSNGVVNRAALREMFRMLMAVHPGIEVYLLDRQGGILAYSAPPGKVKRDRVSLAPVEAFLGGTRVFPILGDDPRDTKGRKIFSASAVPPDGPAEGYLYVILGGEEYDTVARMLQGSYVVRLSTWAAAGGVLFALAAGLLLFNRLTARHRRLAGAVEAFRQGGFAEGPGIAVPFDPVKGDEIDRLAAAFSGMAERIAAQIRELRRADGRRRELLTHVSHDLRTPLTSLQGYLETLSMKDPDLSPGERKEHLRVALRNCRRLAALIAELFELARLDAPDVPVRPERFSPGDLIQDLLQKFRLEADGKKIRLSFRMEEGIPLAVGDLGLISRVLENLIGNALRATPENGEITVSAARSDRGIAVRVSDTGAGMTPEQVARLSDAARGDYPAPLKDEERAGLGLVIARRILELHGSGLRIESEAGAGSTFEFTLPAVT